MELVFSANSAHETKKNNLLHYQALILPPLFFYLLTLGKTTFHILVECRTSELIFYYIILFISVAEHWSVQNGGLWFESWQGNKKFFFVRYSSKTLKLSFARYLPTTWCRCNCMWLQIMVIITVIVITNIIVITIVVNIFVTSKNHWCSMQSNWLSAVRFMWWIALYIYLA